MISFASDYIAGAHPKVLQKLCETNLQNLTGYGSDIYCESAAKKIKTKVGDADVFFVNGGTAANQIIIDTMLRPYEGVISPVTGHVSLHEAGAIEYTGHKVLPLPAIDGKLSAEDLRKFLADFSADENKEQMVPPGMVYLSFPTEYGTLYRKEELTAIHDVAQEYQIPVFIDGARLAYGLAARDNNVGLLDFLRLCEVFYIGGTKCGTLAGEAVVFKKGFAPEHFLMQVKRHGGLLAKGRLLGVEFDALFTDRLYFEIGEHGIRMAEKLKAIFEKKGYRFFLNSPTNQQFVILKNSLMEELRKEVVFSFWEKYDESSTVVRFATSWSTTEEDLDALDRILPEAEK